MSNTNTSLLLSNINAQISLIQDMIDSDSTDGIPAAMDTLKGFLSDYEASGVTEDTVANDLNFALSQQSMTIEEREKLLDTKTKQIEVSTVRNTQTQNMLTVFIIINIIVILVFIVI